MKNPFNFGLIRRADGKARTIKPTPKALELLRQVRDYFAKNPEHWIQEDLYGPKGQFCVLGALTHFATGGKEDFKGSYPHDLNRKLKNINDAVTAELMLIETVNGKPTRDSTWDYEPRPDVDRVIEQNDWEDERFYSYDDDDYCDKCDNCLNDDMCSNPPSKTLDLPRSEHEGYRRTMEMLNRTIQYAEKQIQL